MELSEAMRLPDRKKVKPSRTRDFDLYMIIIEKDCSLYTLKLILA